MLLVNLHLLYKTLSATGACVVPASRDCVGTSILRARHEHAENFPGTVGS